MIKHTSKGIVALVISGLLVIAPLTATSALAADFVSTDPVVDTTSTPAAPAPDVTPVVPAVPTPAAPAPDVTPVVPAPPAPAAPVVPVVTAPPVVPNVTASLSTPDNLLRVTWEFVTGEVTSYTVYLEGSDGSVASYPLDSETSAFATVVTGANVTYTASVTASNSGGESERTNSVIAGTTNEVAANAVGNLTVVPHPLSADITWDAPTQLGGSAISSYSVSVFDITSNQSVISTMTPDTTYSAILPSIGHLYSVSVTPFTGFGAGAVTSVNFTTPPPVPASPIGVTGALVGGSFSYNLHASWASSDYADTYDVTLRGSDGSVLSTSETGTSHDFSVIMDRSISYVVSVTARNVSGASATSSSAAITLAVSTPGAVNDIYVNRSLNSDGFDLNWAAPLEDGGSIITGYSTLVYDLTADRPVATLTSDGQTTFAQPDSLIIGHNYSFTVTAKNALGSGVSFTKNAELTLVSPSEVDSFFATPISATQIKLTWNAGYNGGAPIDGYTVSIGAGMDVTLPASATSYIYTVPNTPGATLTPSITVNSANGTAYTQIDVTLPSAAPDAPLLENISVYPSSYQNASIGVSAWSEDNSISSYRIDLYQGATKVQSFTGATGVNFSGLLNSTVYTVHVVAINYLGQSAETVTAPVTTLANRPDAPTFGVVENTPAAGTTVAVDANTITATPKNAVDGDWIFGYAYSDPTPLGWAKVINGKVSWNLAGLLPDGNHHLALMSDDGGTIISSNAFSLTNTVAPVTVLPPVINTNSNISENATPVATAVTATGTPSRITTQTAAEKLASTGADAGGSLLLGALLMLVGIGAVTVKRVRARKSHSA